MRHRRALRLLALLLLVWTSFVFADDAKRTRIVCEGDTFTYRSGSICQRCKYTTCCIFYDDGTESCNSTQDYCEDCSIDREV